MKITKILSMCCIAFAFFSKAEATTIKTFQLKGSIGQHISMDILDLDGLDTKVLFTDVTTSDFDNGYIIVENAIQMRNIRSNEPIVLKIKNNGWLLPTHYDTSSGAKTSNGVDSEFQIQVDNSSVSSSRGTMEVLHPYYDNFTAVTNAAGDMVRIGNVTASGKKQGLIGGSIDIDAKMLLDPVFDIPGDYQVQLELTVASQL